ncbi:MAG TPA: thermonuclease family protein [Brevibacterium sp.]|nr:thermonuclease family protein [Brevibacterium sp.]
MDGDTLRVSVDGVTERLRIIGIDAPELRENECYAQKSASKMQSLVQSKDVRIVADPTQADRDRYDRILRHVFTLDGTSVGQTMILEGLAKEYTYDKPYASQAEYLEAEEIARTGGLGIWGACDIVDAAPAPTGAVPLAPQPPAPPAPETTEKCLIKGNINSKKEKIYHVPGQRHYEETIIDESKGEAWFCTEQEAVEAGWRKAKR